MLLTVLAIIVVLEDRVSNQMASNVTTAMKGLVDQLKEYNLDTNAGVLICHGRNLGISYMDPSLKKLLGDRSCIEDLLPLQLRMKHRQIVSRYVGTQTLPDSLNHPLRNVQILKEDGETMRARLIIGKVTNPLLSDIYYVVVQLDQFCGNPLIKRQFSSSWSHSLESGPKTKQSIGIKKTSSLPCLSKDSRRNSARISRISMTNLEQLVENIQSEAQQPEILTTPISYPNSSHSGTDENIEKITRTYSAVNPRSYEEVGDSGPVLDPLLCTEPGGPPPRSRRLDCVAGIGDTPLLTIDSAALPAPEWHEQATVLCMDIVGFTRQCASRPLDEISGWMGRVHGAVDVLLERHAVRKVESRGDCVVCVTGTGGGGGRDGVSDQAGRMLAFGQDLGAALAGVDGTTVRMGMATGAVALAHVWHGGDTRPAQYAYGAAVDAARRMEQAGRAGAVLLAESAARAWAAERGGAPPALIRCGGGELAGLFDCGGGRFEGERPGGVGAGAEAGGGTVARTAAEGAGSPERGLRVLRGFPARRGGRLALD